MSDLKLVERNDEVVEAEVVVVEARELVPLDARRAELLAVAVPTSIQTPEQYTAMDTLQRQIKGFVVASMPRFDEGVARWFKRHQFACQVRNLFFGDLNTREKAIGRLVADYERRAAEKKREAERIVAEERRKEEERRQKAEAKQLAKAGHTELAKQVLATPIQMPVVTLPSMVPTAPGRTTKKVYKCRPAGSGALGWKDKAARKRAALVADRKGLDLDESYWVDFAKKMQGTVTNIAGIEFYDEDDSNVRV
jgi:hypothetical protein